MYFNIIGSITVGQGHTLTLRSLSAIGSW